eukprot:scaffold124437_cov63-Phaeocystis_antarctica.AAC.1
MQELAGAGQRLAQARRHSRRRRRMAEARRGGSEACQPHRLWRLQILDVLNVDLHLLRNGLNALLVGEHAANRILLRLGQHGASELPAAQGALP